MSIETARQGWIEQHREMGHHPYPAPDSENPERWECKCDPDAAWTAVWRILTVEQIRQKFAHLSAAKKVEVAPEVQRRIREAKERLARLAQEIDGGSRDR